MAHPQKHPLRTLSEQEERELHRITKATSERLDVIHRATALLAVASGESFTESAHQVGLKSGDGVGKLVKRFNEHGLAALLIAPGRGRKRTYTSEQQARILAEVQREPDRQEDQTATWSLSTLRRALRKSALPHIANETILSCPSRAWIQLSADTHVVPHRLRAAQAQKWDGDRL